ncbi:MAG: hypothetical protein MUC95_07700 [Spirochaetes bacterium]|jgi:hypothetical protein|nr:hypothetical protein [Spirochaetota bacterium]
MKGFAAGIFTAIFMILIAFSVSLSVAYFYGEVGKFALENSENTRRYTVPLAEAVSDIAENCHVKKDYSRLKKLIESDIFKKNVKEAFFVLADGSIIAHSVSDRMESLKGNLLNDKKLYNAEKIFLPLKSKSAAAQFLDYNIQNVKIPFRKETLKRLAGYYNNKIDITGWLVSKAVIVNGNGIGCICFLIGKDRLYRSIEDIFRNAVYLLILFSGISFLITAMAALAFYVSYRRIAGGVSADFISYDRNAAFKDAVRIDEPENRPEHIKISSWDMTVPVSENDDMEINSDTSKIIKDAIPVSGK